MQYWPLWALGIAFTGYMYHRVRLEYRNIHPPSRPPTDIAFEYRSLRRRKYMSYVRWARLLNEWGRDGWEIYDRFQGGVHMKRRRNV